MQRRNFIDTLLKSGLSLTGVSRLNKDFLKGGKSHTPLALSRNITNIDKNWRFHLGDIPGSERPSFPDGNWRHLDLPHDWSIESEFSKDNASGSSGAFLPGGIGWYRKELLWDASWKGNKIYIDFDGVYMNSDVWINGHLLGHRPYGYISFRYDITPFLNPGKNIVAVRADNSKLPSARWYTGSGIYRHVWLNVINPVHVDHWGTFVSTPEVSADKALVNINTIIVNDSKKARKLQIEQRVLSHTGQLIAQNNSQAEIKDASTIEVQQILSLINPLLWSPDYPNLYDVETTIKEGSQVLDQYNTPLGIRKMEFSANWGFRLNGESLIFKGTCNHDDGGGAVGAAVPDDVLYKRLLQLKEMGSNAVRTTHNPGSPEFYTFCDILGLMVIDEAFDGWEVPKAKYDYGLYFSAWWKTDLESLIRRDRNHPSVVMWSIGNEVKGYSDARQKEMVDFVHGLDNTRPVTQGILKDRGAEGPYIDVVGFNGYGEEKGVLEAYHKEFPDRPMVGTEMTHTLQTRGAYRTQTAYRGEKQKNWDTYKEKVYMVPDLSKEEVFTGVPEVYKSSYDNCIVRINVRDQFKHDSRYPFLMGSFRWSGFDYLGEGGYWPSRTANYGIIDLAGFPKDHYYLYQSLWSQKPMVHLLPHWTHPGKEGVVIPVVAYSNCEKVELFFNNISLGEQKMNDDLQLVWQVPYYPGMLLAIGKNADGYKLAEDVQQSAGTPRAIRVTSDKQTMRANGIDVARLEITIVDEKGVLVPSANNLVQFNITGPGKILGVENGDIIDMDPVKSDKRKAFMGKCVCLVQSKDKSGMIRIQMKSDHLKSSDCIIQT